jgi:hypothetical protein
MNLRGGSVTRNLRLCQPQPKGLVIVWKGVVQVSVGDGRFIAGS